MGERRAASPFFTRRCILRPISYNAVLIGKENDPEDREDVCTQQEW